MQKRSKRKQRSSPKNVSSESDLSAQRPGQKSLLSETETSDSSRVRRARPEVNDSSTKTLLLTAEEFDSRFDEGESVFDLGFSKEGLTRPGLVSKRFNVDVPAHMLEKLDHAAQLRGMTRQALVKSWLYDRLEKQSASES
jgi:hypothetical protein